MNKLGFGIIGCGMIANWHSAAIDAIKEAELKAVFDANPASAERFAAEKGVDFVSNLDEFLAREDIDVVCICTPSGLHAELGIKVANAKKHIILEKPMAITSRGLDELIKAVEENGVKAAVISQLRFTPAIMKVKKAIDEGKLGKLLIANINMKFYRSPEYFASSPWRGTIALDGGGALMNQGIHGVDMLTYLAGPVRSVYGLCKTLVHKVEVEDAAKVLVEFENGAIGCIEGTTCVVPGYPRELELCGEKGCIVLKEDRIKRWDIEGEESHIDKAKSRHNSFNDPTAFSPEHHITQFRDLIDAIREDRKPLVDVYEGRRAVDIILAAYRSSKEQKRIELK